MNHRLIRLLLLSYPSKWRDEFGSELEELLRRRAFRVGDVFNVLWGGFTERTREPFTRFLLYSLLGSALVFLTSELFARPLWRILVSPVTTALQQQGAATPGALVQLSPFEGLEVVWLGIPLLMTVFVTLAWMLILTWIFCSKSKDTQKREWARRFVPCSGTLLVFGSFSFVAWQHGSVAKLLHIYPGQDAPLLSVGHCYVLLALSTIGLILLLQAPAVAFFAWRFRTIRGSKIHG